MDGYRRYNSAYPSPDCHGQGYQNDREYLYINSAGVYHQYSPILTFMQSGRRDYYFTYNYDGSMFLQLADELIEIGQGDAFYLRPGQPFSYWYENDGKLQNYWTHFTGYGAGDLLGALNFGERQVTSLGQYVENGILFKQIIDELESKKIGYQSMCAGYLMQLIATVSRQHQSKDKTLYEKSQIIMNSLQYIRNHYREKLRVADLARNACMSINRFEEEFRAHTGYVPSRYIMVYRIEQAIGLINSSSLSMGQIAEMTGFDNQMYFSRVFKQLIKVTPSMYREKYTASLEK